MMAKCLDGQCNKCKSYRQNLKLFLDESILKRLNKIEEVIGKEALHDCYEKTFYNYLSKIVFNTFEWQINGEYVQFFRKPVIGSPEYIIALPLNAFIEEVQDFLSL